MLGLIISLFFVFFGFTGAVLVLSGMLNSYQEKKMEYMAYRNQAKAKHILHDGIDIPVSSEEEYYKSHGMVSGVIDINFISREIKSSFLNPNKYTSFLKKSSTRIVSEASKIDLGLVLSQTKITVLKFWKTLITQYLKLVSFLIKITQPVDSSDLGKDRSSTRSAVATSSRIKRLTSVFSNNSKLDTGTNNKADKNQFPDTKLNIWPHQNNDTESSDVDLDLPNSNGDLVSEDEKDAVLVYQQLENEILDKLSLNITDYDLWENLGNLYQNHEEYDKAKEIYSYILKHSHDESQIARISNKTK